MPKTAAQLRSAGNRLFTKAACEGRPMTDAEQAEYDRSHAEADTAGRFERLGARRPASDEDRATLLAEAIAKSNREIAAHARGSAGPIDGETVAAALMSGEYRRAFADFLTAGHQSATLIRASVQGDPTGGGGFYLAPPQFESEIVRRIDASNPIRRLCNTLPLTTALEVQRPTRTSDRMTLSWAKELAAPSPDDTLTFGSYTLVPHHLVGEVEVSRGVVAAGAEEAVKGEIAHDLGEATEQAFLTGNGVGRPLGMFVVAETGIPASRNVSADPAVFATWTRFFASLKAKYLRSPSAAVILHRTALQIVQDIAVGTAGYPLWTPPSRPGEPGKILGVPAIASEYAPTGSGTNGAFESGDTFALAGDLMCYDIQESAGMGVRRFSDSPYDRRGVVGYLVRTRVDAAPRVPEAFARLVKA